MLNHVHFEPSVEDPVLNINQFLGKNQAIRSNTENFKSDLSKAFSEFITRMNFKEMQVIILTGIKAKSTLHSRVKRATTQLKSASNTNFVYGSSCAAVFNSIYLIDASLSGSKVKIDLSLVNSTFECSSQTSTLTLNVATNGSIYNAHINQLK